MCYKAVLTLAVITMIVIVGPSLSRCVVVVGVVVVMCSGSLTRSADSPEDVVLVVVDVDFVVVVQMDPDESANMEDLLAVDPTQAVPQSVCSKDVAPENI